MKAVVCREMMLNGCFATCTPLRLVRRPPTLATPLHWSVCLSATVQRNSCYWSEIPKIYSLVAKSFDFSIFLYVTTHVVTDS